MLMLIFPVLAGLTLHLLKAVLLIKDKFPLHKTLNQDLTKGGGWGGEKPIYLSKAVWSSQMQLVALNALERLPRPGWCGTRKDSSS